MTPSAAPSPDEYGEPYAGYIRAVPPGRPVPDLLALQLDDVVGRLAGVPEARGGYRYAERKWSVKQVVLHLADVERVMAYRALRIARTDATPLPGFDEDLYAAASGADARSLASLTEEWAAVRRASLAFFQSLAPEAWARRGQASGHPVSVRALGYIIAGHTTHHCEVLADRYGLWPSGATAVSGR